MDSINVLLDYFNMFKKSELSDTKFNNIIEKCINLLNKKNMPITCLDDIETLTTSIKINNIVDQYIENRYKGKTPDYLKDSVNSIKKGLDNTLCDIFYNVIKYNNSLVNKKENNEILEKEDLLFDSLDVNIKDILNYLEVKEKTINKSLIEDLSNYKDLKKLKEFATIIKTDNGMKRVLFDKIEDKNVLLVILMYSNLNLINSIIEIFEKEKANINRVVNNIPSIFIKNIPNNIKYKEIIPNYDTFINNYKLIKENNIDFKKMLNQPVFLINDSNRNKEFIDKLSSMATITKNVIEHVGNICAINPTLIFKNISILSEYNISLTNDDSNGYTLLGMNFLREKIEYLIRNKLWKAGDNLDLNKLDMIRSLVIRDDYSTCNNKRKYDNIDNASYEEENIYTEDSIRKIR